MRPHGTNLHGQIISPIQKVILQKSHLSILGLNCFGIMIALMYSPISKEHIWTNHKEPDLPVSQVNVFEILINPKDNNHNYLGFQIIDFSAVWNLLLQKIHELEEQV